MRRPVLTSYPFQVGSASTKEGPVQVATPRCALANWHAQKVAKALSPACDSAIREGETLEIHEDRAVREVLKACNPRRHDHHRIDGRNVAKSASDSVHRRSRGRLERDATSEEALIRLGWVPKGEPKTDRPQRGCACEYPWQIAATRLPLQQPIHEQRYRDNEQ